MFIASAQIIIPIEKITGYLLIHKERNDKSRFLNSLGYTIINWKELKADITAIAENQEAIFQRATGFGDIYLITGKLRNLTVVTIWLLQTTPDQFRFITLFPEN